MNSIVEVGGKWIRHRGGKCPVAKGVKIEVKHRDGEIFEDSAGGPYNRDWSHTEARGDIMQYRIISQTQAEEVDVKEFMSVTEGTFVRGPISLNDEVVYPAEAQWQQSSGPLAWRDTIIHCQAIIEDCEREIERNVQLLDAEGLMMQIDSKKAMQHYASDVDMGDWRNLREGDIIECLGDGWSSDFVGLQVTVKGIERADYEGSLPIYAVDDEGDDDWGKSYKFIRRP